MVDNTGVCDFRLRCMLLFRHGRARYLNCLLRFRFDRIFTLLTEVYLRDAAMGENYDLNVGETRPKYRLFKTTNRYFSAFHKAYKAVLSWSSRRHLDEHCSTRIRSPLPSRNVYFLAALRPDFYHHRPLPHALLRTELFVFTLCRSTWKLNPSPGWEGAKDTNCSPWTPPRDGCLDATVKRYRDKILEKPGKRNPPANSQQLSRSLAVTT